MGFRKRRPDCLFSFWLPLCGKKSLWIDLSLYVAHTSHSLNLDPHLILYISPDGGKLTNLNKKWQFFPRACLFILQSFLSDLFFWFPRNWLCSRPVGWFAISTLASLLLTRTNQSSLLQHSLISSLCLALLLGKLARQRRIEFEVGLQRKFAIFFGSLCGI